MYLKSQLGPLQFIAYTENGVDTIKQHNVNVHLSADDTQVYARVRTPGFVPKKTAEFFRGGPTLKNPVKTHT